MRVAAPLCLIALVAQVACTSFVPVETQPLPGSGTMRVVSSSGLTVTGPHPVNASVPLTCAARAVTGVVTAVADTSVWFERIWTQAPASPLSEDCRRLSQGLVMAAGPAPLQFEQRRFDPAKTTFLVVVIAAVVLSVASQGFGIEAAPSLAP